MKQITVFAVTALLLLVFLCGCEGKNTDQREYIGIISAMDNEIEALLSEAEIDRVDTFGNTLYHVGRLRGQPVVITRSGIGKVRASSGATALFNNYKISKVIFTGIAGGIADEAQVLDVVVATRVLEHDYGRLTNDGFIWLSGDPGFGDTEGEYYYCDQTLVDLAYTAAVGTVGEAHAFKSTVATGDQFIASEEYVRTLRENYDAYACEMEGTSVGAVCLNYGIPFVVIRALSDKADGKAHESYAGFGDIACANSSKIVLRILESIEK